MLGENISDTFIEAEKRSRQGNPVIDANPESLTISGRVMYHGRP